MAVRSIMADNPPDLVLSGVNRGQNVAEDVTYSGTIAAAMEGTLLGAPTNVCFGGADLSVLLWANLGRWHIGMNAKTKNPEAAAKFLNWVASDEFATIYANALPGFFSLSSSDIKLEDPLAAEMVGWRKDCKSTIRSTYQILSRGTPNLENETWIESANVINGTVTPEQAGEKLQKGLDSWYKPAK